MNTKENKQFQNEAVHQIKKTIPQKERISALLNTIASLGLSVISAILAVQENAPTWIVILILLFSITALFGVILAFRAFHKICVRRTRWIISFCSGFCARTVARRRFYCWNPP